MVAQHLYFKILKILVKTLPFIMNLATYVLIVTSYFWVHNGVEIMRGPPSIIQ
jgi:hypothetical protein